MLHIGIFIQKWKGKREYHEAGENEAVGESWLVVMDLWGLISVRLGQGGGPHEDEHIHRAFEERLNAAQ